MPTIMWADGYKVYKAICSFILHRVIVYRVIGTKDTLIFRKIHMTDAQIKEFMRGVK